MMAFIQKGLSGYGAERFVQAIISHLQVSAIAFLLCMIIGVPLGIICANSPKAAKYLMTFANFMKVIPSLAIMILLLPVFGAGATTPIIVFTILGLPPIMVNTCLGIRNIDPKTIEAARGIGMDHRTILYHIQIPLALPMILTGVRTSGIQVIACATLAYYIGGGGMGSAISYGFMMHLNELLVISSITVAGMTAILDLLFAMLQRWADAKYSV